MSDIDIGAYNRRWLKAWTDKNVDTLLAIYADDIVFRGPDVPDGVVGAAALGDYLRAQFAATPPISYAEDEIWPIPGGFCARWYARMHLPAGDKILRGFDLVQLAGDRIALNEVYTHMLP